MYIDVFKNNSTDYLRLMKSYRAPNKDGVLVSKKKTIYNIGPLRNYDDGKPDYILRLRKSFKDGNPLIKELLPYCKGNTPKEEYTLKYTQGDKFLIGEPKKFSQIILENIIDELGIVNYVTQYKHKTKIEFDLLGFMRLLIYGRILNPSSKIGTVRQNNDYYIPIIKDVYEYNVYDTLDFIYENKSELFNIINKRMQEKHPRKDSYIFYDVTNAFFEIERPDEDDGLRKKGVSKEKRQNPIVQTSLFMDQNGFPISLEVFPGNTLDHQTLIKSFQTSISDLELGYFIFIGDRGITNYPNLLHIKEQGGGYIVSKSILKSTKDDKKWVTDTKDYINFGSNFKYKSRIITKTAKDRFGKEHQIQEKEVVYWSRKFYERQRRENKSFLEFLEKLKENPTHFRITKTLSNSLKRFVKKEVLNVKTGEIIDTKDLKSILDFDKINAHYELMGYYKLVTTELDMPDIEVIKSYKKLTEIENLFRIMKGAINMRPIYVWKDEHIEAHLSICVIALLALRIIQHQIKKLPPFKKDPNKVWQDGLSAERIISALNKWQVDLLNDEYYKFLNTNDKDLSLILKAFGIEIEPKLYKKGELKRMKTSVKL